MVFTRTPTNVSSYQPFVMTHNVGMPRTTRLTDSEPLSARSLWGALFGLCVVLGGAYFLISDVLRDREGLPPQTRLDVAEFAELTAPDLAAMATAKWEPVSLTHVVCCDKRAVGLRMYFDAPEDADYGLIPVVGADNYRVWVNGVAVRSLGSLATPRATYHGNVRQLTRLPKGLLKPQDNLLEIIAVRNLAPYIDLYPAYVGPFGLMDERTRGSLLIMNEVRQVGILVMGLIAVVALVMLYGTRNRAMALWLFGLALNWCLYVAFYRWYEFPGSPSVRMGYFVLLANSVSFTWLGFVNAFTAGRTARWNLIVAVAAAAWALCTLASWLLISFDAVEGFDASSTITIVLGCVFYPLAFARVLWSLRQGGLQQLWESAVFLICLALLCVDVLGELFFNQAWGHGPNATVVFLCALLAGLVARNVRWHESLLAFNEDLSSRLVEREREIERSAQALAEANRERDLSDERQRILRDIHDGVGGRLAALAGMLRGKLRRGDAVQPELLGDVEASVAEALQDLRLVIDSLDVLPDDLGLALGTLRPRLQSWLAQHDIRLIWNCELSDVDGFGPQDTLDIYRLVQEACNNAVRHAQAEVVSVTAIEATGIVEIRIEDDGVGMLESSNPGRGLVSMRSRAMRLGGELAILPGEHCNRGRGTLVLLRLSTANTRSML